MAPDRGHKSPTQGPHYRAIIQSDENQHDESQANGDRESEGGGQRQNVKQFLADRAESDTNFTIRGVLVGLSIGIIICFSNMYFGLQTGWVSGMAMPASLLGFAFFRSIHRVLKYPFTPVENVLVQTVAGAVGTMPLGVGCVGVLPALNFLLKPSDNGPVELSLLKLTVWSVGICFLGVFVAVPLRKEVIIREKLRFPSGTATALMIGVLHGEQERAEDSKASTDRRQSTGFDAARSHPIYDGQQGLTYEEEAEDEDDHRNDWKSKITLLTVAFGVSAVYVRCPKASNATQY